MLKGIEKTGSLRQTAAEQGMSYRKAWMVLKTVEKRLGFRLLDRKIGGASGGGSTVTPSGKTFISKYERFRADANKLVEQAYRKHFK